MSWLLHCVRTHRLPTLLFLAWLLAVWCVSIATWIFDEIGTPIGIHPLGIILTLTLPFTAAMVVGWWRLAPSSHAASLAASVAGGAMVGTPVAVISLIGESLLWLLVYPLILRRPLAGSPVTSSFLDGLAELFAFAVLLAIIGSVLGAVGGLIGGLLGSVVRLVRHPQANGAG